LREDALDTPTPFLPRHLTLIGAFTIGLPAFILTLERNVSQPRPGFLFRTLRFAMPAGTLAAIATYVAFDSSRDLPGVTLGMARTMATLVLSGVGLWILSLLMRPMTWERVGVLGSMVVSLIGVAVWPETRAFFGLSPLPAILLLAATGIVALTGLAFEATRWVLAHVSAASIRRDARPGLVDDEGSFAAPWSKSSVPGGPTALGARRPSA